jgi:ketosteroid isomerase-like protein
MSNVSAPGTPPASSVSPAQAPGSDAAVNNAKAVRDFFAAYTRGDPAAMAALLAEDASGAPVVYDDPSFGHLEGADKVGAMWKVVAGGNPPVTVSFEGQPQVSPDGRQVKVQVVESYKFLGNDIANHITSTFQFNADGKIVRQQDEFDWGKWAAQVKGIESMPIKGLGALLATKTGHALVTWFLNQKLNSQLKPAGWGPQDWAGIELQLNEALSQLKASGMRAGKDFSESDLAARAREAFRKIRGEE